MPATWQEAEMSSWDLDTLFFSEGKVCLKFTILANACIADSCNSITIISLLAKKENIKRRNKTIMQKNMKIENTREQIICLKELLLG